MVRSCSTCTFKGLCVIYKKETKMLKRYGSFALSMDAFCMKWISEEDRPDRPIIPMPSYPAPSSQFNPRISQRLENPVEEKIVVAGTEGESVCDFCSTETTGLITCECGKKACPICVTTDMVTGKELCPECYEAQEAVKL